MNAEQIKSVIEIVTSCDVEDYSDPDGDFILYDEGTKQWLPEFDGQDWQHSQSLAIVEWLANKIETIAEDDSIDELHIDNLYARLVSLINLQYIDGLQEMVLELSGEKE